jgi:hypothetical protein
MAQIRSVPFQSYTRQCHSQSRPIHQRGMMLIILMFIVGLAATTYLVYALNANTLKIERDKKTAEALSEAKNALIGWSAGHATLPGTLPCPDLNNSGTSGTCNDTSGNIGRLPWKRLGLNDLRDGSGECLWYALSPRYRNTLSGSFRVPYPINGDGIPGTLTVKGADGNNLPAPVNPVIAVIIAPGAPLTMQNRSSATSSVCGGNNTASNYLDTAQGVDNSTGNVSGINYTFIAGAPSNTFNDRLIYITAGEFYQAIRKRMVKEILGNVTAPAGPADYYNDPLSAHSYPCPAATPTGSAGTPPCDGASGFVNNSGMELQYAALGSWLVYNGWFALANYSYTDSTHVKVTVNDHLGSYSCIASSNVFSCASP